ncbi:MAG: PAS domain-containing protein, partial [Spirochaetaceae bacterium]
MRLPSVNRLRAGVRALRRPLLAAGGATALLFAGWLGAGEWYRSIEARAVRAEGREMLAWVEARVRGAIGEGHARLVALESFIHPAASEHVERAEFQTFARCLTEGREEFRRITVVPAEGEEFVYPPFVAPMEDEVAGGEARAEPFGSLGTRDRPGAAPAEETGRVVMSGPYAADGGPPVLFLRKAVYHDGAYWGVMSLVLDVKQLMQDAGVRPVTDGFCVRIRRAEASEPFFGCGGTFEDDPVRREFDIFGERWELEAVPAGGMAEAIGGPLALFRWLTLIPVVLIPVLVFNVAARGRILQRRLERRTRSLSEQLHERTRAEQRLEAERALLERISATSPVGIVVLDAAGRITFANPHARRLLGIESLSDEDLRYDAPRWGAADLDGNPVREEDYPFRRVMATGRPAYDMRLLLYIGGATRVISVNAAPISRSGKEEPEPPTAVVMTVDDISEQVRAERRARKLNRLYAVLSNINQSIIRVRDAETLFGNVARVAVAEGEFAGVWVAIADGQKRLRVIAGDGVHLDGEEEGERIVVSREAYRDHPARTALTTGSYAIVN